MITSFQIVALDSAQFIPFFNMNQSDLKRHHAKWVKVDTEPGYPCRVSLQDAAVGEQVLLLPYKHHDESSPYRASGPIFVRELVQKADLEINQVPIMLRHRQMSLRAYDQDGLMLATALVSGKELEPAIIKLFHHLLVDYIHIHNAGPGCFNCAVFRA